MVARRHRFLRVAVRTALVAASLGAFALAAHAGPRLIVQFDEADVEAAFVPKSRVERLGRAIGAEARHVRRMALGAQLVELPEGADVKAAARDAKAIGGALRAFAERRVQPAKVPNDPFVKDQRYLTNDEPAISAFAAWDITTGSPSIVVAVVDTGVLPSHPDLAGRILPGYDFISDPANANDGDGRDMDATDPGDWVTAQENASGVFQGCGAGDSSWHGTGVAGVVAANANNGLGVAGVDWSARILPVRVLGKCGGSSADILDAIAWAAGLPVPGVPANPFPAHVINLSLGHFGDPCDADEDAMLARVLSPSGVRAIVAGAGNNAGDANQFMYAACPSTISVTATAVDGDRTVYANYGTSVDIAAPGGDPGGAYGLIYILSNFGTTVATDPAIAISGGTSFSAPMVSGVVSLMLSVAPNLTPAQVRSILQSTAKPFPSESRCTQTTCGKGIVDARHAVLGALAAVPPAVKIPVVEYFNAGFGHYFMTADADEIAGLDAGAFGGAFVRSGRQFQAWNGPGAGTLPVCRFFTTPGNFGTKSSHFYTASAAECEYVKLNPDWIYEKIAFHVAVPANGACAAGTLPVYRAFNRGQTGAPNHRFTTDLALYQQLTTMQGWDAEGIVFCAPP